MPERLRKANGVLMPGGGTREAGSSTSPMDCDARWDSTDQVPQRLLEAGQHDGRPFGRFGSLDPTDGGSTRIARLRDGTPAAVLLQLHLRWNGRRRATSSSSAIAAACRASGPAVRRTAWRPAPKAELTLDPSNLDDRKVVDIEYFCDSQLPGEAAPVAGRHPHPAEPRTARRSLRPDS